jgi:hypothetical protein
MLRRTRAEAVSIASSQNHLLLSKAFTQIRRVVMNLLTDGLIARLEIGSNRVAVHRRGFLHGGNGAVDGIDDDAADAIGDDFRDRCALK